MAVTIASMTMAVTVASMTVTVVSTTAAIASMTAAIASVAAPSLRRRFSSLQNTGKGPPELSGGPFAFPLCGQHK
ncbi:hypothetical protein ACFWFF_13180 [Streptomyces sp. NPDC060223]|uniref:hypothetical protein n=1 Tax=unclassified Streptomyces TaxID=2593676 RepID=UPI0036379374